MTSEQMKTLLETVASHTEASVEFRAIAAAWPYMGENFRNRPNRQDHYPAALNRQGIPCPTLQQEAEVAATWLAVCWDESGWGWPGRWGGWFERARRAGVAALMPREDYARIARRESGITHSCWEAANPQASLDRLQRNSDCCC
jgi:hypothetical protein